MIDSRSINDLHPVLQRGAYEFLKRCSNVGLNVLITSTYRDNEAQNALYARGRSKPGKIVTNAKAGESIHNYALAFDICKNIKGQEFSDSNFFKTAGNIWQAMGGEWGGSWTKFVDLPHMQFTGGLTLNSLQKGNILSSTTKMNWELSNTISDYNNITQLTQIEIDGNIYLINRILKNGKNYIDLRGLEPAGFKISYNETKKIPIVKSPKY